MLVLAAINRRQEKLATLRKAHPFTQAGPAGNGFRACSNKTEPLRRRRPKSSTARPLSQLSAQSLVFFLTLVIVWIPWAVITPLFPHGLQVHLVRPGVQIPRSSGVQALLVQVEAAGIFIDSERMTLDGLRSRLKQELARRPPDWPVYVQGDPDLEWRAVAEAIDVIRGAQAGVVLLPTPRKPITPL